MGMDCSKNLFSIVSKIVYMYLKYLFLSIDKSTYYELLFKTFERSATIF